MEHRRLGHSEQKVPVLSPDTATSGGDPHGWGHTDVAGATRMVDICLDAALTMFDRAGVYSTGRSEDILCRDMQMAAAAC